MKKVTKLAWLALLGFAAIGMWAQDDSGQNAAKPGKATVAEAQGPASQVPAEYVIGADDTLHISGLNRYVASTT
jgi:hypothetical protein